MNAILARPRLTALLAGLVSATGFAPLQLWPLAIACVATLILLVDAAPDRRAAFLRGWLFGVGHFAASLNWIAHAFTFQQAMPAWFGYAAILLLSLYLALFPGLAALAAWGGRQWLLTARLATARTGDRDGFPAFLLLLAASWIGGEYLRATLFTGFAWNPLGIIWLPTGAAIASTVIGTYGLGALTILAAGALLMLIRRQWKGGAAIAAPLALLALWGQLDRAPGTPPGAPRIRVVQPDISQDQKYSAASEMANYRKLATLSGTPRPAPRLIFWPEAAIPAYLDMEPEWRDRLAALLGHGDLLMTGADKVYFQEQDRGHYVDRKMVGAHNSLWIVTPDARLIGRYDKAHLVPYGEYLPMRSVLSAIGLSRLVPGDVDYWPGPGPRSLDLPATPGRPAMKMGVQICYEIIFSGHVIDRADRPAFLFNPSNDAWFGSWGPVQHLAQARLRALEEGIPIIRSTPTGISAVIDARGRIVHSLGAGRAGFLDTGLPGALPPTIFAHLGNWAALLLAGLLVAIAIATRFARR